MLYYHLLVNRYNRKNPKKYFATKHQETIKEKVKTKCVLTVQDKEKKRICPMLDIVLDMSGGQYQCEYQ